MSDSSRCPNCGEQCSGRFCAHCGQKDEPLRQSTLYFLRQAFNQYFGIDGRLWITLRLLLFRPGRLTSEHLGGRRRKYVAPLRLYLTVTVLFFFLLSILDPAETLERKISGPSPDSTVAAGERLMAVQAELDSLTIHISERPGSTSEALGRTDNVVQATVSDSLLGNEADLAAPTDPGAPMDTAAAVSELTQIRLQRQRLEFQRSVLETYPADSVIQPLDLIDAAELLYRGGVRGVEVTGFGDDGPQRGPLARVKRARTRTEMATALSDLTRSIIENIPIVMFLMLPVFALLMKFVYLRRGWYYSEHLIFALHNHAVAFIGFTIIAVLMAIAENPRWVSLAAAATLASLIIYFLMAQKHVYDQSWTKTMAKYLIVFVSYWSVLLFFGLSILFVLGSFFG